MKDDDDELDDHSMSPPSHNMHDSRTRRITEIGTAVSLPPLTIKEKPPINVVGDVGGRIAIMVDDLIDDVKPFIDAALILKGLRNIINFFHYRNTKLQKANYHVKDIYLLF